MSIFTDCYDDAYKDGYSDGYAKAIDEFVEAVENEVIPGELEKMEYYTFLSVSSIKKIAEQLKGVQNDRAKRTAERINAEVQVDSL